VIIQSGKYEGLATQELVLKQPDWVQFFLRKNVSGKVAGELARHISDFDSKPIVEDCFKCDNTATRVSAYSGNALQPMFWCSSCDPYSLAARKGKLSIMTKYSEALRFVDSTCDGRRSDKRALIRRMAEAKGLPKRVGKAAAVAFLP